MAEVQALKSRVDKLEMLVEQMIELFVSFSDDLMRFDLLFTYPDIATETSSDNNKAYDSGLSLVGERHPPTMLKKRAMLATDAKAYVADAAACDLTVSESLLCRRQKPNLGSVWVCGRARDDVWETDTLEATNEPGRGKIQVSAYNIYRISAGSISLGTVSINLAENVKPYNWVPCPRVEGRRP